MKRAKKVKPDEDVKEFMSKMCEVEDRLTMEEAGHALKLAKKFNILLEYTIQLTVVAERQQKHQGFGDCYVWGQTLFELGVDYSTGKKLTAKDIITRLADSIEMVNRCKTDKSYKDRKWYWDHEVELCSRMLRDRGIDITAELKPIVPAKSNQGVESEVELK